MDVSQFAGPPRLQALLRPGDIKFLGSMKKMERQSYKQSVDLYGSRREVIASVRPMVKMLAEVMDKTKMSVEQAVQHAVNYFTKDETNPVKMTVTIVMLLTAGYLVETGEKV